VHALEVQALDQLLHRRTGCFPQPRRPRPQRVGPVHAEHHLGASVRIDHQCTIAAVRHIRQPPNRLRGDKRQVHRNDNDEIGADMLESGGERVYGTRAGRMLLHPHDVGRGAPTGADDDDRLCIAQGSENSVQKGLLADLDQRLVRPAQPASSAARQNDGIDSHRCIRTYACAVAMNAWQVTKPGPLSMKPLQRRSLAVPEPGEKQVRVRIKACGVCRTDLHIVEGDLPVHRERVVPGHQVVGVVDTRGPGATRFRVGERIGIPWLGKTCGRCRFCLRRDENLCSDPRFTGWDNDGGYAEYAVVHEDYAYRLPDGFDDEHVAPLLCAGIIGYRALRRSRLPSGGRLGIYGFGGSAHIACQIAVSEGATVHVLTRSERARKLALDLGAATAADALDGVPAPLDAAIVFAPAGGLVPIALEHLDRGATLALAGVHLTDIPSLDYSRHLFGERDITSVTANTRADGRELLETAARIRLRVATTPFGLNQAAEALAALAAGQISGAGVLMID
jgi:propanol-preferring alcohol dehydrogenase